MAAIATTTAGRIEGLEKRGVLRFAGIPYAAPPVGEHRFRPPRPVEGWSGTRAAHSFGPQAWQDDRALGGLLNGPAAEHDEDCLSLNITTPALDDAHRPVLFWIHGGGFVGGSGATPWYNGHSFVTRSDVVVVTINYRLGALGFLHLADLGGEAYASSGLNGILDQVAALEWVRDNIAAFGGDPGNVTIFGESAGGMSVGTLLGLPRARGLFHKAIPQSGAASNLATPDRAAVVTDMLCEELGVHDLDGLLHASPEDLVKAQAALPALLMRDRVSTAVRARIAARRGATAGDGEAEAEGGSAAAALGLPFQPVIDGVEITEAPLDAVRRGLNADVPVMVGTTLEEWKLFQMTMPAALDRERAGTRLARMFPTAAHLIDGYDRTRTDQPFDEVWSAIMTDAVFRIPAIRLAEAQSVHQPDNTFMYRFSWRSKAFDGRLGSCHALEIPFMFNALGAGGASMFLGVEPDDPTAVGLAETMNDAWARFARHGDPNVCADDGAHSPSPVPAWAPYDTTRRATMDFDEQTCALDDPDGAERELWDGLR